MLIRMFARERSQIICIFCHNLLALLLQMFAEFYLGISSIGNARNNLVAGETVLALLWFAIQSEDKLLAVGSDDGLGGRAMHDWLPVAILPLTYIPSKSRAEP